MALKLNPFTGEFDYVDIPLVNGTTTPTLNVDGDLQLAQIANNGRVYFRVNGTTYYLQAAPGGINIPAGQPIGFANYGMTYAGPVT